MATPDRQWFYDVVSRCQELAGHVLDERGPRLGRYVHGLASIVPVDISVPERFITHGLIGRVMARTAHLTGIDRRPEVAAAFLEWTSSDAQGGWPDGLYKLIDTCASALENDAGAVPPEHEDPRVARALSVMRNRYHESTLTLADVARDCGVSVSYTTHMLRRRTGLTFGGHLHRIRVDAARRFLEETVLTVKEIAALTGYGSSSQFGRHFKRLVGTTAVAYRSGFRRPTKNDDRS